MIVRSKPATWQLLFILRGSIVPAVAPRLLLVAVLAALAVTIERRHPAWFPELALAPFTLIGLALSIFLSFRNNACYDRWWEARKLWGQLIVESRCLARDAEALLEPQVRDRMVRRAIAFAHALAARLRGTAMDAPRWLDADEWLRVKALRNPPESLLREQNLELAREHRAGRLDSMLYTVIEKRLAAMSAIQAACERILNTPLPFAYTLLLHRTAMLFCILLPFGLAGALGWATPLVSVVLAYTLFGLDVLGDELEEPFGLADNDLPLEALVRTIEIDLLEALGERELPEPLLPRHYVLR